MSLRRVFWLLFFFFSSRRRHTRSGGDWSSDVCSSDLRLEAARSAPAPQVDVTADLRQRQILTRTILAGSRGVLSPEMERQLVERGDHDVAEQMIGEVRRHVA